MKRKFEVNFELDGWDVSEGVIELDQKVIDQVDDEWRSFFYPSVDTPEKVASMIANCMCIQNLNLSNISGQPALVVALLALNPAIELEHRKPFG